MTQMRPMINSQLYLDKGLSKLINHVCIWYISTKILLRLMQSQVFKFVLAIQYNSDC